MCKSPDIEEYLKVKVQFFDKKCKNNYFEKGVFKIFSFEEKE